MLAFDDFRLDPQKRILWRGAERVALTPKAFELLLLLVQRAGTLATRDELIATLWPDSFVEEANLTQTVFMLRKALGRTAEESYIVTVPGQGYRFAAEVREIGATSPQSRAPAPPPGRGTRRIAVAAALGVVLIGAAVALSHRRAKPVAVNGRMMLAVLPFENLTGDPAQEYFSDGLTEEMITQIGKLDPRYLGVIARTSVMPYKVSHPTLEQIERDLKVHYVLEGSVRRDTDKVRITAKLVQVADQSHVWTREYDRELAHLLALERDIAQDIAAEIQLTLEEGRGVAEVDELGLTPAALAAYDAYLKGRYHWNRRTIDGFEEAIKYFTQAIEANPDDARAYAGLADCYSLLPGYKSLPSAEYVPKARAAALQALRLNDGLAEAHTSLALIVENNEWDWAAAERGFKRAIELNPNYATAHHWYSEFLAWQGRFDEALRESERARQLDPLSLIIAADNGVILYYARQFDLAEKKLAAVLELEPGFPRAHMIRHVYVQKGHYDRALADIASVLPDEQPWDLAYVLGRAGRIDDAKRALAQLAALNEKHALDPATMAWANTGMGNVSVALDFLDQAYAQHSNQLTGLKVDPGWDPLRGEPRYQELLKKVGLGGA